MSIETFPAIINTLRGQADAFESSLTGAMQGRTVQSIESSHAEILGAFKRAMGDLQTFKTQIHNVTTQSNQEQMIVHVEAAITLETRLEKALTRLNNHLLTLYPTAAIDYGKSCIGQILPPVSEDSDVNFQAMLKKFNGLREIRGDGNCFVASFTTRFIETLLEKNKAGEFIRFLADDVTGSPEIKNAMSSTLMSLQQSPSQLEKILADNQKILPFISYFRHLAADEMKSKQGQFEVGFRADLRDVYKENTDSRSFADLVDQHVLPMGIDLSQPMITALCQRLHFSVRIFDSRLGHQEGFNVLDKEPPRATFCRKGAHYFVLYTPDELKPIQAAPPPAAVQKREIVVKCHVPFGHTLFIRGGGCGLQWDRGVPLTEVTHDTWIFRSKAPLEEVEYKFLIDDQIWENGDNHRISQGHLDLRPPQFPLETRITVRCATKPGEKLFIRGTGPGMSWDHGIELRHLGGNSWVFECQGDFKSLEYKILLNDTRWELDGNHTTECGKKEEIAPRF